MDQDSAYRGVFSFQEVVEDFLKEFVDAPWVKALDLPSFEREGLPAMREFQERANTVLWGMKRKDGKRRRRIGLMLQFQVENDDRTPLVIAVKVSTLMRLEAERKGPPVRPVVAIVLYSGLGRWTRVLDIREIIGGDLPVSVWRSQISVPYRVVEERFCSLRSRPQENLGVLLFQAERCQFVDEFLDTVERFSKALQVRDGSHVELERALVEWLRHVVLKARAPGIGVSGAKTFDALREETERLVRPWAESHGKTALAQSREAARVEGIKRALGSYARTRFGDRLGALLADSLAPIQSAERLLKIGALLAKSRNGSELLRQLRDLWDPSFGAGSLPDVGIQ